MDTVSIRALNIRAPIDGSEAHGGTSPHRAGSATRSSRLAERRTIGADAVGAMFQLGVQAPAMRSSASNKAAISPPDLLLAYLPHMTSR
ncbi:hypothetical protein GCM10027447_35830 [Glycomyces halotolerans]